ncbi:hypothetical protein BDZ97DRAFT_1753747 [Flammula alnicola]|nr:hypothetical protein BDZ97DRAFT_1764390 [Flammula alnicola]KAF8970989.1 hypothetical protein BDZ97DRAFT_1753747 [Flammula alnicola]
MPGIFQPDQRREEQSPVSSDSSTSSGMPTPTTPTTTPTSSPNLASDSAALGSFLAEVDEWLIHINQRVAELESRHKKHLSMEDGWLNPHLHLVDKETEEEVLGADYSSSTRRRGRAQKK